MYIIKICHTERRANRAKENLDVQRKNERTLAAFESKYCVSCRALSVYNVCVRVCTNAQAYSMGARKWYEKAKQTRNNNHTYIQTQQQKRVKIQHIFNVLSLKTHHTQHI